MHPDGNRLRNQSPFPQQHSQSSASQLPPSTSLSALTYLPTTAASSLSSLLPSFLPPFLSLQRHRQRALPPRQMTHMVRTCTDGSLIGTEEVGMKRARACQHLLSPISDLFSYVDDFWTDLLFFGCLITYAGCSSHDFLASRPPVEQLNAPFCVPTREVRSGSRISEWFA